MIDAVLETCREGLVRWVDGVRRRALAVVLLSVAATFGAGYYFAGNVRINTDTSDMLSPELEFRRHSRELSDAFPQFSDNILLVIDAETPDMADDAALALAERLRGAPGLFGEVYDLAGEPFFRANGLLYKDRSDLAGLSDRLAEAQPFLGALWRDPSLRGFAGVIGLALDGIMGGRAEGFEIAGVLDAVSAVARAQSEGRFKALSWQGLMSPEGDGEKGAANRRFLLIQPALDYSSLQPATAAMGALRVLAREMGFDGTKGVTVRLTGAAALAEEELKSVERGMGLAGAVSLVLVLGLLAIGLRSLRLVAAMLATLIAGLVWTAAFAIAFIGQLNLISVAFAVLFIGLSVDFGIHFALRYREELNGGSEPRTALTDAARGVGGALALTAAAAAIAFYSFLPTAYLGLAELGLIAGTGMFIAFFANLTVLPAFITLFPPKASGILQGKASDKTKNILGFLQRHPRPVVWAALAVGVASAALVPAARFDFDPLHLQDPETESVATLYDLMEDPRTTPYTITVLSGSLEEAVALAEKLKALAPVKDARTLADYIPKDQDEKLDLIATMALFLSPSLSQARKAPPGARETERAVAALRGKLVRLAALGGAESRAAERLANALAGISDLKELEARLLSALPGRLEALKGSLAAGPVTLADLPASLRTRQIAPDGRAKVEVYPRGDMSNRRALARFVRSVRTIAPNATGMPVVIFEAGDAGIGAFRDAALIAVSLIALMLLVLLRSVRDVALVFAPLVLAALMTVAASVLFGLPFNFANVIVLPLLFGLGVAGGIHLVSRRAKEGGTGRAILTSTPRAIVFSALTTIGSFGSIALSGHPGTASMGMLLTLAVSLSLLCTLGVLPALMALGERDGQGAPS